MLGLDFHRQKLLDHFIVDFYCPELQLAIEIDGDSHDYSFEQDKERQERLEHIGIKFLRFQDKEVKQEVVNVLREIERFAISHMETHPYPLSRGEF